MLALTKSNTSLEDLVNHLRADVGPDDFSEISKHPDSLRAHYATNQHMIAIHASENQEAALK